MGVRCHPCALLLMQELAAIPSCSSISSNDTRGDCGAGDCSGCNPADIMLLVVLDSLQVAGLPDSMPLQQVTLGAQQQGKQQQEEEEKSLSEPKTHQLYHIQLAGPGGMLQRVCAQTEPVSRCPLTAVALCVWLYAISSVHTWVHSRSCARFDACCVCRCTSVQWHRTGCAAAHGGQ